MNASPLALALDRAEQALDRIEQHRDEARDAHRREAALRDKVGQVVAELDAMIRDAGNG